MTNKRVGWPTTGPDRVVDLGMTYVRKTGAPVPKWVEDGRSPPPEWLKKAKSRSD